MKSVDERLYDAEEIIRKKNAEIAEQRRTLVRLQRDNDEYAAIEARVDALSARNPQPPEWVERPSSASGNRGVPMTIWSDWHWEEVVSREETAGMNEFNPDVAKKRVQKLVRITKELCYEHMGRAPVKYPGCIVCLGGDMITGDIHDELVATNAQTTQEAIEDVTDNLCAALDNMATAFGKLFVPCVVGNHGRSSKKPRMKKRVATSYEYTIYRNLARYFSKSRHIQFSIPKETDVYFRVFGHRYLLTHGDSLGVKGGDGIIGAMGPIMRGALKVGRSESQIGRDIDTLLMGHWHQYLTLPGVIVNNALIGYNEYARLALRAPYSRPSQSLWFTHPEHGITTHWQVYLEGQQTVHNDAVWVEWQK